MNSGLGSKSMKTCVLGLSDPPDAGRLLIPFTYWVLRLHFGSSSYLDTLGEMSLGTDATTSFTRVG